MAKVPYDKAKKILTTLYQTGGQVSRDPVGQTTPPKGSTVPKSVIQAATPENNLRVTKQPRRNVIIITPFMAEDPALAEKMKRYAARATKDSLNKNEAPLASHLFYYSVLNEKDPIERDIGLQSQLSWLKVADVVAVYVDFSVTPAMKVAIDNARLLQKKIEFRTIGAVA
ncbi:hypothetical protein [Xanthomonas phage X1]|nr:hypothetical protein [Xanthomonas phage X1]